jgi:hypothetical protein
LAATIGGTAQTGVIGRFKSRGPSMRRNQRSMLKVRSRS